MKLPSAEEFEDALNKMTPDKLDKILTQLESDLNDDTPDYEDDPDALEDLSIGIVNTLSTQVDGDVHLFYEQEPEAYSPYYEEDSVLITLDDPVDLYLVNSAIESAVFNLLSRLFKESLDNPSGRYLYMFEVTKHSDSKVSVIIRVDNTTNSRVLLNQKELDNED